MTKKEATQILAILKAAYPNSYKNMTVDEANGTATVWSLQLKNIPAKVVFIAINKWISQNPFPPSISEVIKKIDSLYWELWNVLKTDRQYKQLTAAQVAEYEEIFKVVESIHSKAAWEPSLHELTAGSNQYLISG